MSRFAVAVGPAEAGTPTLAAEVAVNLTLSDNSSSKTADCYLSPALGAVCNLLPQRVTDRMARSVELGAAAGNASAKTHSKITIAHVIRTD
jgi:hypothetical protein